MSPLSDDQQQTHIDLQGGDVGAAQECSTARSRHTELCALAVKWLKRPNSAGGPGCLVAVSEVAGGWSGEIPDAIGFSHAWGQEGATVIEVKVTRSDFLADRKKPHREEGQGMGTWRYYMAPEGLIGLDELPAGWGLIEVNRRGHCKVLAGAMRDVKNLGYDAMHEQVAAWRVPCDAAREQWLLVRLLARLGDPEKLNQQRREEYRERSRLIARVNAQNEEIRELRKDIRWQTRQERQAATAGEAALTAAATPRQVSVTA